MRATSEKLPPPVFDVCMLVPMAAFAYILILAPLLNFSLTASSEISIAPAAAVEILMTPRPENKIVWPLLTLITLFLVARNFSRLTRLPANIICLFAYLGFAGLSILWAFKPEFTLTRFVLQAMIVSCIVLPTLIARPGTDIMRGVYFCFAAAVVLNVPIVFMQSPISVQGWHGIEVIGYPGYFSFKGELGQCAAIAFLLSLYELLFRGWRRALALVIIAATVFLMLVSKSKGSLGMAIIAPIMAGATLFIGRRLGTSPAITILPIPITYAVLAAVMGNIINRISWYVYGNYDLSGRMFIWDFVNYEISKRPILGWGYQSFWLVGPDGPSLTEAPGWIRGMPSGHNGYLDTQLDLGYPGLLLLVAFIMTTLHAIGHVAKRNARLALLLLTLAFFVILQNFLETVWMHGQDTLWMMFLLATAVAARYVPDYRQNVRPRVRRQTAKGPLVPSAYQREPDTQAS